jgi:hypothetical protein
MSSVSKFTAGIAGVSTELGQLAEQGRNPTTAFEHKLIQDNVSLTNLGANLGKTGKDLKDFTAKSQNMAIAMNRSAEQAGEATGQFNRMKTVMVATGIDSEKTLLKISEASGVQAQVFADSSMQLANMQGMSKKAGASILDTMTAAGQAMGDVSGSLKEAAERTALLQRRSALLSQGMAVTGIEEFSKQIDSVSVSFQKATGASAATARAFGTGLAATLQESAQAFKHLTVGVGSELPESLKGLALTTGDVQTAFNNMGDGPEAFMDTMKNLTKGMKGDKKKIGDLMTWIEGQSQKSFGPERSKEIVNMLMLTSEASDEAGKKVKNATGALKKYGEEAWKSGRTAAESLKLSEDLFVTGIRAANHTASKFASDASKSFSSLGKDIQGLAKSEGGVGDLTRSLIDLNQKGLVGLFPDDLQGDAVAMGGMFKMLGETLKGILNPLSGIESLFTLFTVAMRNAFKNTKASLPFFDRMGIAFKRVGDRAVKWFEELPKKILGWINSASVALNKALSGGGRDGKWGGIFRKWWDRILDTFTAMGPVMSRFKTLAGNVWTAMQTTLGPLWADLKKFVGDFWSGLTGDLGSNPNDSDEAGKAIGKWIYRQWQVVVKWWEAKDNPIKKFGMDFWEGLTKDLSIDPNNKSGSTGESIGIWINSAFSKAVEMATNALPDMLMRLFATLVKATAKAILQFPEQVALAGATKVASYFKEKPAPVDADDAPSPASTTKIKLVDRTPRVDKSAAASVELLGDAVNRPDWYSDQKTTTAKQHEELVGVVKNLVEVLSPQKNGMRAPLAKPAVSHTISNPKPQVSTGPTTGIPTTSTQQR